jgi:alanyl-tRNA synthetase
MPTRRLFDLERDRADFEDRVAAVRDGEEPWVALEATAFFPAEGGQRADRGVLQGITVVDVTIDDGGVIWHRLESDPGWRVGTVVAGQIDPITRKTHSQLHTGQHILSRAFVEILGAETRSFHMGEEAATIDVDVADGLITPETIRGVELRANTIVFDDRKVVITEEARAGLLPLRTVVIDGFDEQHCCGTHVLHTGEVGLIKTLARERIRSLTRFEFVCGYRTLREFQELFDAADGAARALSSSRRDLHATVGRLVDEAKESTRALRAWQERWAVLEAERLAREAPRAADGVVAVIAWIDAGDPAVLRAAADTIIAKGMSIAVLAGPGAPGKRPWLVARSADLPEGRRIDARETLERILSELGGRGGGTPAFAQGATSAEEDASRAKIAALAARTGDLTTT